MHGHVNVQKLYDFSASINAVIQLEINGVTLKNITNLF
jgi:hypothetical protein